jgi:hypothetical protein
MKSEYLDGFRRLRFLQSFGSEKESKDREKINSRMEGMIMRNINRVSD